MVTWSAKFLNTAILTKCQTFIPKARFFCPLQSYEMFSVCFPRLLTSMPGKGVTSDPVAIRIFLVETFSVLPSFLNTVTSFGPVILPWPFIWVTWEAEHQNTELDDKVFRWLNIARQISSLSNIKSFWHFCPWIW